MTILEIIDGLACNDVTPKQISALARFAGGPISQDELAKKLGIQRHEANARLKMLVFKDWIVPVNPGIKYTKYRMTIAGEMLISKILSK
jgi:Mn-dependent DtxR family transcriptional regulator